VSNVIPISSVLDALTSSKTTLNLLAASTKEDKSQDWGGGRKRERKEGSIHRRMGTSDHWHKCCPPSSNYRRKLHVSSRKPRFIVERTQTHPLVLHSPVRSDSPFPASRTTSYRKATRPPTLPIWLDRSPVRDRDRCWHVPASAVVPSQKSVSSKAPRKRTYINIRFRLSMPDRWTWTIGEPVSGLARSSWGWHRLW